MKKYIVQMVDKYSREVLETMEEEFDDYKEACDYSNECANDFAAGAEELELAGREFVDENNVEFIVETVER